MSTRVKILTDDGFQWTGMGCDVCGFGTVDLDEIDLFDPKKPCPGCGRIMHDHEIKES